jgi:hypothetical protein
LRAGQQAAYEAVGLKRVAPPEPNAVDTAVNKVRAAQSSANGGRERMIRAYRTDIKKDVWVPESKMPELTKRLPGVYQIRD